MTGLFSFLLQYGGRNMAGSENTSGLFLGPVLGGRYALGGVHSKKMCIRDRLYRQETDPKKRTFRVWYLIANPRGLPKEFVQKELEFRWKLFPEKKEEPK